MRRTTMSVLASLTALALLSACGSGSSDATPSGSATPAATPTFAVTSDGPAPAVNGKAGSAPTLGPTEGKPSDKLIVKELTPGKGRAIAKGDLVLTDFLVQKWGEDKPIGSTYAEGAPTSFPIGMSQVIPAWEKLIGTKVGTRVEMVVPPAAGFGAAGNEQAGIKATDTLVFVFDVRGAYAADAKANGAPGERPAAGLPTVADGEKGPVITVPKGAKAPTTISSTRLITGEGAEVKSGQTIVVQYTGALWDKGTVFDSSWERGAPASFVIGKGAVIPGWDETLVGTHVGDRVMLVIPPDKAYRDQAQGAIPANSTLVFVVDVIDAL
ncbi:MAG TPA: FKBP-type peptidyl-prolyl cis-trans isomerase [Actinomycetes bacterium]|nr:FKBP-type peptidyl-prolyl cis-trans isomerase [Actinomycetes bacterium]